GPPADDLWLAPDFGPAGLLTLLGPAVAATLGTVLPQLASTLLYADRRLRTENLAPALTAAAAYVPAEPEGQPELAHTA
ncbi:hypothetical protein P8605_21510, partial [Streptomyces sp. T-3]|nr:hypothetical protein [Streptomyces sp. T-3]